MPRAPKQRERAKPASRHLADFAGGRRAVRARSAMPAGDKRHDLDAGGGYRHFPTREDLILAVHRNDVGDVVDHAAALLATATPPEAPRTWLHLLGEYGRLKHGVAAVRDTESRSSLASADPSSALTPRRR